MPIYEIKKTDSQEPLVEDHTGALTQKIHTYSPFALDKLVKEKWVIKGNGQIRE
jgi:glutamate-5-semialdehyde dehydrogenase